MPRGRANAGAVVQGFEIVEEDDDDDDDEFNDAQLQHNDDDDDDDEVEDERAAANDDDDDDDDIDELLPARRGLSLARNGQLVLLNDNEQDDEQDDDDDDDEQALPKSVAAKTRKTLPVGAVHGQPLLKTAKPTQMMVARDQAGAIMVPDGIVEIEGQSVVDEKTGKAALLVPRAALDAIPDGAVVALMERSAGSDVPAIEQERANRVIVRRRKNNGRRNAQRRRRPVQQRRRVNAGGQRRRRVNVNGGNRRRGNPNVRVIRPNNRRRGNAQRRRGGQVMLQG